MKKHFIKFVLSFVILLLISSCIPKMDFFIERIRMFSTNLIEFDFGTTSTQILSHLNENFSEITIEVSSRKDNLRTAELNWEIKNFTENTAGDFTAEGTINELPSNIIYRDGESATDFIAVITIRITGSPQEEIVSIQNVSPIDVDFGTNLSTAISLLSSTTTITDSASNTHTVNLNWTIPTYNGNSPNTYPAFGTIAALPETVKYPSGKTAADYQINTTVTVLSDEPPEYLSKKSGPTEVITQNEVTFEWEIENPSEVQEYRISRNEGAWQSRGTNTTYTWSSLTEGNYNLRVRAHYNDGTTSNIISWDFEFKEVILTPDVYDEITIDKNAIFSWQTQNYELVEKFEISKNNGTNWSNHLKNTSYTWLNFDVGQHKLLVRAVDIYGNQTNTIEFDFERVTLQLQKKSGNEGTINESQNTFEWEANYPQFVDYYAYDKNHSGWIPYEKNEQYTWEDYDEGANTFEVRARIKNGGSITDEIRWNFIYEKIEEPSDLVISKISGSIGEISTPSNTFSWNIISGTISNLDYYVIEKDGITQDLGTTTTHTWTGYDSGTHTFKVWAVDKDEKKSNILIWTFTYTPENISELIIAKTSGPDSEIDINQAQFNWNIASGNPAILSHYMIKKDNNPAENIGTTATYTWTEIIPGTHTFKVWAVDNEGLPSNEITWDFEYSPDTSIVISSLEFNQKYPDFGMKDYIIKFFVNNTEIKEIEFDGKNTSYANPAKISIDKYSELIDKKIYVLMTETELIIRGLNERGETIFETTALLNE